MINTEKRQRLIITMLELFVIGMAFISGLYLNSYRAELVKYRDTLNANNETLKIAVETIENQSQYIKTLEDEKADLEAQMERLENLGTAEKIQRVIAAEARGCSLEGQMAVAQTILDRATLWNMTAAEVISQPSQYAPPYQGAISSLTAEAYERVFINGERVFEKPATHFYNFTQCSPAWADRKTESGIIGDHRFMY